MTGILINIIPCEESGPQRECHVKMTDAADAKEWLTARKPPAARREAWDASS